MKALGLELVLVHYLDERGALMLKLDQVSGQGEICGINVQGQEVVDCVVEDWEPLFCLRLEVNLE